MLAVGCLRPPHGPIQSPRSGPRDHASPWPARAVVAPEQPLSARSPLTRCALILSGFDSHKYHSAFGNVDHLRHRPAGPADLIAAAPGPPPSPCAFALIPFSCTSCPGRAGLLPRGPASQAKSPRPACRTSQLFPCNHGVTCAAHASLLPSPRHATINALPRPPSSVKETS